MNRWLKVQVGICSLDNVSIKQILFCEKILYVVFLVRLCLKETTIVLEIPHFWDIIITIAMRSCCCFGRYVKVCILRIYKIMREDVSLIIL